MFSCLVQHYSEIKNLIFFFIVFVFAVLFTSYFIIKGTTFKYLLFSSLACLFSTRILFFFCYLRLFINFFFIHFWIRTTTTTIIMIVVINNCMWISKWTNNWMSDERFFFCCQFLFSKKNKKKIWNESWNEMFNYSE